MDKKEEKKDNFDFSFIPQRKVEVPIYTESVGKEWVSWGVDNNYPHYLWSLYLNNSILGSIINSIVDFTCGDAILNGEIEVNTDGETLSDIIRKIAYDVEIFGGYALQVLRNGEGAVSEVYVLDFRKVRTNVDGDKIFYNTRFGEFGLRGDDTKVFKAFDKNEPHNNSVLYFKGHKTRDTYPIPPYYSAIKQIETGIRIGNYHLNAISNGLSSNYLINFNNGQPTEEVRKTIERKLLEKFTGDENCGHPFISWNKNKETAVTIEKIPQDDFDKKYEALAKDTLNAICVSMRCAPVLIGMNPENNGFSQTEYKELYSIFNKTTIQPIQRQILKTLRDIYGRDIATIVPYNIGDIVDGESSNKLTNEGE